MKKIASTCGMLLVAACGSASDNNTSKSAEAQNLTETASASGLLPGFWETRTEVKGVKGYPVEMPDGTYTVTSVSVPQTSRDCVTPKQAAQPFERFLAGGDVRVQCDTAKFSMADGRISGSAVCELEIKNSRTEYTLDGRYTPTSYDVTTMAKNRLTKPEGTWFDLMRAPNDVETRVVGRRLGDCPEVSAAPGN